MSDISSAPVDTSQPCARNDGTRHYTSTEQIECPDCGRRDISSVTGSERTRTHDLHFRPEMCAKCRALAEREAVGPWRVMVSRLASYLRAGERLNEQDEADIRALLERAKWQR